MILPSRLERLGVFSRPGRGLWSHVRVRQKDRVEREPALTVDVDLTDSEGSIVARLHGLRMQRVQRDRLMAAVSSAPLGPTESGKAGADSRRPSAFVDQLHEAPQGNRLGMLVDHLRSEIVTVLGWDSPQQVGPRQKLFDLGMDSLTSVELQQRLEKTLGCPLPLTLAFDYPTVEALAAYIADQLELIATEPVGRPEKDTDRDQAKRVAAMSEDEVQSLLADKLKDLL
jgi:acyl carrier protein